MRTIKGERERKGERECRLCLGSLYTGSSSAHTSLGPPRVCVRAGIGRRGCIAGWGGSCYEIVRRLIIRFGKIIESAGPLPLRGTQVEPYRISVHERGYTYGWERGWESGGARVVPPSFFVYVREGVSRARELFYTVE